MGTSGRVYTYHLHERDEEVKEKFLLKDTGEDDPERILVFGTPKALKCMSKYGHWAWDCTFDAAPDIFFQFGTNHVVIDEGFTVPTVYCCLPNKTEETYKRLLKIIKELGDVDIQPETCIVDFETAMVNAIHAEFEGTEVFCCQFHLSQNVYRQGQKKWQNFKRHSQKTWSSMLQSIACLP